MKKVQLFYVSEYIVTGIKKAQKSFNTIKNKAEAQLKSYLGLVFQHYIKDGGVKILDHKGVYHHRKINLKINTSDVLPIDPLLEEFNGINPKYGVFGTHIKEADDYAAVKGVLRPFKVKMAVVPGLHSQGGKRPKEHDDHMTRALAMRKEAQDDASAPITDCQGLYIYRNMRLIEFSTWKGVYTIGANHTCARAALYCPTGLNINDKSLFINKGHVEDFTTDPTKTQVFMSNDAFDKIESLIGQNVKHQWHKKDDRKFTIKSRADGRINYDKKMNGGGGGGAPKKPKITLVSDKNEGEFPLEVTFTCKDIGAVKSAKISWNFGDGTEKDGKFEESHKYTKDGTFRVTAQGVSSKGKFSEAKDLIIKIGAKPGGPQPGGPQPGGPQPGGPQPGGPQPGGPQPGGPQPGGPQPGGPQPGGPQPGGTQFGKSADKVKVEIVELQDSRPMVLEENGKELILKINKKSPLYSQLISQLKSEIED